MKRQLVFALLSATAFGCAYAARPMENDALAITAAKVDLTQAVAAAERHVGGKASRAEYEQRHGRWVYEVEVAGAGRVMDVRVDATNGNVIAAVADEADRDKDDERED
jgi:uncharacterized membrane protein YkoI